MPKISVSTILLLFSFLVPNLALAHTIYDLKKDLKIQQNDQESLCRLSDYLVQLSKSNQNNYSKSQIIYLCEGHERDNKGNLIDPIYDDQSYQNYCSYGHKEDKKILMTFEDSVNNSLIVSRGFDGFYITYLLKNEGFALISKTKPNLPKTSLTYYLKINGCVAQKFNSSGTVVGLFKENTLPKFLRSKNK